MNLKMGLSKTHTYYMFIQYFDLSIFKLNERRLLVGIILIDTVSDMNNTRVGKFLDVSITLLISINYRFICI